jgi:hypothetical protein
MPIPLGRCRISCKLPVSRHLFGTWPSAASDTAIEEKSVRSIFSGQNIMQITPEQAISDLIQAKAEATNHKIAFAVAGKQLSAQRQMGDAMVNLVEQAATMQKQLAAGRLDVKA